MQAFGDLYDRVWWDNANPVPVWQANGLQPYDMWHMREVIQTHNPQLILTFGNVALAGLHEVHETFPSVTRGRHLMGCHHPNARHKTQVDLDNFVADVTTFISTYESGQN